MKHSEETYIIAKMKILPFSECPDMIYPLEVHWFTDNKENAKNMAKKINWMYWKINKF